MSFSSTFLRRLRPLRSLSSSRVPPPPNPSPQRQLPSAPALPGSEERTIQWPVPSTEHGSRLDRFIKRRAPGLPPGLIQRLIRQRRVSVNTQPAIRNATRVVSGDTISLPGSVKIGLTRKKRAPPIDDVSLAEADMVRSWVLHSDARAIVLNKPAGLPVLPRGPSLIHPKLPEDKIIGQGDGPSGVDSRRCLQDLLTGLGRGKYWLVHRLDTRVSGAIVMARDAGAAGLLSEYFRTRQVNKLYWALLRGKLQYKYGNVQTPIDGKSAYTAYRVVQRIGNLFTWVELFPRTGRKHQLRIHCSDGLGCPIVGDVRYGDRDQNTSSRYPQIGDDEEDGKANIKVAMGLHLMSRVVRYPVLTQSSPNSNSRNVSTAKFVQVTAPLPQHMHDTWERLGLGVQKPAPPAVLGTEDDNSFDWNHAGRKEARSG